MSIKEIQLGRVKNFLFGSDVGECFERALVGIGVSATCFGAAFLLRSPAIFNAAVMVGSGNLGFAGSQMYVAMRRNNEFWRRYDH